MGTNEETKVCSRCGVEYPLTDFYIKHKATGYRFSWCKYCHVKASNARYHRIQAGIPKPEKPVITEKACTTCGEVKPLEDFNFKDKSTGRRRSVCRKCQSVETVEYKTAHRKQIRANSTKYYAEHKEELLERQKKWRAEHPEQARKAHSKWQKQNLDKVNAATHRRRSNLNNAEGNYTAQEWRDLKAKYDHRCLMCGRQEPDVKLTVDHIVPPAKGGTNSIDNIQPLCKSCNSKKHQGIVDLRKQD